TLRAVVFGVALQTEHESVAVHDASGGRYQRRVTTQGGFKCCGFGAADAIKVVDAVRERSLSNLIQAFALFRRGRHNELSQTSLRSASSLALVIQRLFDDDAQMRL